VAQWVPLIDISPMPVASLLTGTEDAAVEVVRQVGVAMASRAPGHRLSALQDVQRGRRVELEETVGFACRMAGSLGLDVSVLRTCYHLAAAATRVVA
jgi:ketopantoate reductase